VQFDTINGKSDFICFNKTFSFTLAGTALQGHTSIISQVFGSRKEIAKAFIHVPATPMIGDLHPRGLGDPAKLVIAAHELIHACGLDDSEHSSLSDPDLYSSPLQSQQGVAPANDSTTPFGLTSPVMPPLVLAGPTITLIQNNWN
jgi:hypothetical protein